MDSIFVLIAAAFLDPVRAGLSLVGVLVSRRPWVIALAAAFSTLVSETILFVLKMTTFWGEVIVPGTIASVLQAVLLFAIVSWVRSRFAAKQA